MRCLFCQTCSRQVKRSYTPGNTEDKKVIQSLEDYIDQYGVSSDDWYMLTKWADRSPVIYVTVYKDGKLIGHTTSGTKCPYINKVVAAALVDSDARKLGDIVQVDVRGNMIDAVMVKSRFYERGASK